MRPLRVFLCHASQDKPTVWRLHRYLKQHGIKPWLDREDLLPGEDWEVEIPRAIFTSDVILVCLSRNSVNKEGMVQKEITFALDKALEKPEGTIFIIPVKLEECEIPRRLTRYQWVDLSRVDGRRRLLMGLNKRVNDLGEEVQQITLDDTRHRTPVPKSPKAEPQKPEEQIVAVPVKEELKKEVPAQISSLPLEEERREDKFIQNKPFTKLLDPSSLSSKETTSVQGERQSVRKSASNNNARWLGIGGLVLLVLIFGGFGLNYLIQNLPAPIATTSSIDIPTVLTSSTNTIAPKTPTFINPFLTPPQPTSTTNTPTSTATLVTMISEKDGMTLVYVLEGEFTMGRKDGYGNEEPAHIVYLDAFWIDQTEVTNKQYQACVDAGVCEPPSSIESNTHPKYYGNLEFDNFPVIYVNWGKAKRYCEVWAGGDLPTEAQWEKAARGTNGYIYPWGENIDCHKANYGVPSSSYSACIGDATQVGSYETGKSFYGAYDMAGNVWEWVNDWYDENYYQSSLSPNPLGPNLGQYRVLRGGSWNGNGEYARSVYRFRLDPAASTGSVGFRCARSP